MIRAIFFDLDGTLLSHTQGGIPQSAQKALELLRSRGIRLFLATGRHMTELQRLLDAQLRFDGYVTLNGQLCLDGQKRLVSRNPIPEDDLCKLLALFHGSKMPVLLVEQDKMYINFINEAVELTQADISTPLPDVGKYTGKPVYQVCLYDGGTGADEVYAGLGGCIMTRWNPRGVDIISQTGGKVAGIRHLMEKHGLSRQEIMAVGDGENDIGMLAFAGIGVAMGNACPEAKRSADYVTGHIDSDGLAEALAHFGLL